MRFIEGEIKPEGKSESFPHETFFDDGYHIRDVKEGIPKLREQLTEERWMLKTQRSDTEICQLNNKE